MFTDLWTFTPWLLFYILSCHFLSMKAPFSLLFMPNNYHFPKNLFFGNYFIPIKLLFSI